VDNSRPYVIHTPFEVPPHANAKSGNEALGQIVRY
jgi:hypothetical protein